MDAETYLRCRLEDALIAGDQSVDELRHRARAALAVAAIDAGTAERLLDEAGRALRLRRGERSHIHYDGDDEDDAAGRVVAVPTVIAMKWGTLIVTHVVLGEHETVFGARGEIDPAHRQPHTRHHEPDWLRLSVVDANGRSHDLHYNGSSSDDSFDGEFRMKPPLPLSASSVTVGGQTIDLTAAEPNFLVRVDALADLSPTERAERHLDLLAHDSNRFGHGYGESDAVVPARQTFAALGMDLPEPEVAAPASAPRRRPHRGRQRNTPKRWLAIGATTAPVDGLVLTVQALADDGTMSYRGRSNGDTGGDARLLHRLSARDDRGNDYHFEPRGSSGGPRSFDMRGRLVPDPDPSASRLTLVFDTLAHRIEIDVPLQWREQQ